MWRDIPEYLAVAAIVALPVHLLVGNHLAACGIGAALCSIANLAYIAWLVNFKVNLGWVQVDFMIGFVLAFLSFAAIRVPFIWFRRNWQAHDADFRASSNRVVGTESAARAVREESERRLDVRQIIVLTSVFLLVLTVAFAIAEPERFLQWIRSIFAAVVLVGGPFAAGYLIWLTGREIKASVDPQGRSRLR